jgi:hypothetical protein
LGISVHAPYELSDRRGTIVCIALVEQFGSPAGIVISGWPAEKERVTAAAKGRGQSVSFFVETCPYERERFIEILDEWGWYGDANAAPTWYRGPQQETGNLRPMQETVSVSMDQVLMEVVQEFAGFLDLGIEQNLDAHYAQAGRDRLVTLLAQLSTDDKRRLVEFLTKARDTSTGFYKNWMALLPGELGLTTGPERT